MRRRETTQRQGNVPGGGGCSGGLFFAAYRGRGGALALTTVLIAALAPLVSRAVGYRDKLDLTYAEVYVIAVMRRRERVWRAFSGTLLDAHAEGYDWARDADGNLYDVQTGRCAGVVMREAGEHLRGLQGADSTANAPDLTE